MKYIFAGTICFIAIMVTGMFTWEATRRSADDWAKINQSKFQPIGEVMSTQSKVKSCTDGGGLPDYWEGTFQDCKSK